MAVDEKSSGALSQIAVAVVVALLVGGTAPWWWKELPEKGGAVSPPGMASVPAPEVAPSHPPVPPPTAKRTPTAGDSKKTFAAADPEPAVAVRSAAPQPKTGASTPEKCVVSIRHPLVPLRSEPSHFSLELRRLKPGRYAVLRSTVQNFSGAQESWYEVATDERKGWIQNDGWAIDERTGRCD